MDNSWHSIAFYPTDSDFNPTCPVIFLEMASVFRLLGQSLRGEEGE
jgi:hypothetical protein